MLGKQSMFLGLASVYVACNAWLVEGGDTTDAAQKSASHLQMIQDSLAKTQFEARSDAEERTALRLKMFAEMMGNSVAREETPPGESATEASAKHLNLIKEAFARGRIPNFRAQQDHQQVTEESPIADLLKKHKRHHHHHHHRGHLEGPLAGLLSHLRRPKLLVEVIKINERIMVDENNQPKGVLGADVQKSIYRMRHGRLQRLMASETLIRPRGGRPVVFSLASESSSKFNGVPPGGEVKRRLRLDEFIPRLLASVFLGFVATLMLYLMAYSALSLYLHYRGDHVEPRPYNRVDGDAPNEVEGGISNNDRLLGGEEKRLHAVAPAMPVS